MATHVLYIAGALLSLASSIHIQSAVINQGSQILNTLTSQCQKEVGRERNSDPV